LGSETVDVDKVRHSTKVAWRALANLEKELENVAAPRHAEWCAVNRRDGYACDCVLKSSDDQPGYGGTD
jgi:hypothetical protein